MKVLEEIIKEFIKDPTTEPLELIYYVDLKDKQMNLKFSLN